MEILDSSCFNVHYPATRVFQGYKDEAVNWTANAYRYNSKEWYDLSIRRKQGRKGFRSTSLGLKVIRDTSSVLRESPIQ